MADNKELYEKLKDVCKKCDHVKEAHTWVYVTGSPQIGDCGMTVKINKTSGFATCFCQQFVAYSPLDLCEIIEESR